MRSANLLAVALLGLLVTSSFASGALLSPSVTYPPLKGTLNGPSLLATGGKATYVLTASGGPATLPGGKVTGNYSYNATLSGGNTTGGSVSPATGVLVNETAHLVVIAPNNTGSFLLSVELKSTSTQGNASYTNLSYGFTVAQPYVVTATIVNPTPYQIQGGVIEVDLDGANVAEVTLPTIGSNGTYNFIYNYTTVDLSSGYHTFTLSIHSTPGLLVFEGGATQYTATFYVTPPPPDYTLYLVTGISLTVLAIFISLLVVGGRARRRSK